MTFAPAIGSDFLQSCTDTVAVDDVGRAAGLPVVLVVVRGILEMPTSHGSAAAPHRVQVVYARVTEFRALEPVALYLEGVVEEFEPVLAGYFCYLNVGL